MTGAFLPDDGTTRNLKKKIVMTVAFLPDEIILEILSWLPVESLLRLKCVCKMWCSTIEDPKLINRHMSRAPYYSGITSRENSRFTEVNCRQGLMLEKCKLTNAYQLRNPGTRQVLDLPSPPERTGICANMCYIPATNDLKLVYIYNSEKGMYMSEIVYYVLRVGSDLTWKRLDSPYWCRSMNRWLTTLVVGTVFYSVKKRFTCDFVMDCLDLENDQIKTTIIPLDHHYLEEWGYTRLIEWNGKLSLYSIVQEKLNVWILENYEEHKWADHKLIIPLTFMRCYPSMSIKNIKIHIVENNQLIWLFRNQDHHAIFSFDIESKKVKFHTSCSKEMVMYHYRPNLLHFKGMRPESTYMKRKIDHCDNAEDIFIKSTMQVPAGSIVHPEV